MDFTAIESAYKQWNVQDFEAHPLKNSSIGGISDQLKKQLRVGFIWATAISLFYIVLAIWAQTTLVWVFSAAMLLFNGLVALPMIGLYKKLNAFSESQSIAACTKELLDMYDNWYLSQKKLLTFTLPLVTIYGGFLGVYFEDPDLLTRELVLGRFGLILLLVSIPLSALAYWGFKWLYKHSYGDRVGQLRHFYKTLISEEGL